MSSRLTIHEWLISKTLQPKHSKKWPMLSKMLNMSCTWLRLLPGKGYDGMTVGSQVLLP
jgi:hypothetical protein